LFPRAVYDDALGHVVEWRCAIQQQLTEIIHIPARNVAMETALAAAARMVRYRYFTLSLSGSDSTHAVYITVRVVTVLMLCTSLSG